MEVGGRTRQHFFFMLEVSGLPKSRHRNRIESQHTLSVCPCLLCEFVGPTLSSDPQAMYFMQGLNLTPIGFWRLRCPAKHLTLLLARRSHIFTLESLAALRKSSCAPWS